ncbi:MAG UNVERIFIED_CONTAM: hypothetical protein LVT10_25570 [Anaerolineae bacterium]
MLDTFFNRDIPAFTEFKETITYFKLEVPKVANRLNEKIKDAHREIASFKARSGRSWSCVNPR